MRFFDLALKDLAQIIRDKKSFLFLILMPIIFTVFMGFAFGRGTESSSALPLVAWMDQDQSFLSVQLRSQLEATGQITLVEKDPAQLEDAQRQVKNEKLDGVVVVPETFTSKTFAGEQVDVVVYADSATVNGQAVQALVENSWTRVMSAAASARLAVGPTGSQPAMEGVVLTALDGWKTPALVVETQKAVSNQPEVVSSNPYNQSSPGMIVMFVIFGLVASSTVLVMERKSKTLERMLTTSMRRSEILAGHLLAMFLVVFVQELILVVFGQLAFHVNYMAQPVGILLIMVTLALVIASFGMLIGAVAKGEEQVVLLSMISMFVFSALGGAWFPLEVSGPAFARIGHLTPTAWAMDGFQNILIRGLGLNSALLPSAILLAYSILFFALAVWRFQKSAA